MVYVCMTHRMAVHDDIRYLCSEDFQSIYISWSRQMRWLRPRSWVSIMSSCRQCHHHFLSKNTSFRHHRIFRIVSILRIFIVTRHRLKLDLVAVLATAINPIIHVSFQRINIPPCLRNVLIAPPYRAIEIWYPPAWYRIFSLGLIV